MAGKEPRKGIAYWPKTERPRERLLAKGSEALSDAHLLAILLRTGRRDSSAVQVPIELGRRSLAVPMSTGTRISSSADLFKHFHPALRDVKHELFKVVLLDAKNVVIKETTVSEGSLTLSIVHPREVFALAVRESAAAVIFLHNHPSGDPTPSPEDRRLTDRLITAGKLLGIRVLDHLIVGDGRYVSFADEGWMAEQRDEREDP